MGTCMLWCIHCWLSVLPSLHTLACYTGYNDDCILHRHKRSLMYMIIGKWNAPSLGSWTENFVLACMHIFGKCSEPPLGSWTENFVLACMPIFGKCSTPSLGSWTENFVLVRMPIFGKCSAPSLGSWTENFVLVCMPIFGKCSASSLGSWTENFVLVSMLIFGKCSAPSLGSWTENFVLVCMPIFGKCSVSSLKLDWKLCVGVHATFGCMSVYIYCVYTLPLYTGEYTEDSTDSAWKEIVLKISRTLAIDVLDSEMVVKDEENGCRLDDQGKKPGCPRKLHGWYLSGKVARVLSWQNYSIHQHDLIFY